MMLKRDREATIAQHYLDPRSYVCFDGREVLYGEDWDARVQSLRIRSGGRCEYSTYRGRCRNEARDPDHIVKRSKQRDDRMNNLQALCAYHHEQKHPEKRVQWSKRQS